jgi:polysaccharide export outer membrane protein
MNVWLLSLVLAIAAPAQTGGAGAANAPQTTANGALQTTPNASKLSSNAYILGPDDVVSIKVFNHEAANTEAVVPPDGRIQLELIGPVVFAGKTTDQLATELQTKWLVYYKNILVTVTLAKKRPLDAVAVYGFASKTGNIEYRSNMHILDVIAGTGGGGTEADLGRIVVTHRDGRSETLDLSHPETKGTSPANILLAEGDLIYVPQKHEADVTVLGKVEKPGDIPYKDHMTLLDAVQQAGGVHLDDADLAKTVWTHAGNKQIVDLDAIMNHANTDLNVPLSPGDTIFIPEIRNRLYVFGQVGRAGYYTYKPGDKLLDALKEMGGPTTNADIKHINFIDVDDNKNVTKMTKVDLDSFVNHGNTNGNPKLKPGLVIYVPDKKVHKGFNPFEVLMGLNILRVGQTILGL